MRKSWMGLMAACVVTGSGLAQQLAPAAPVAGGDVLFDTQSFRRLTRGDVTWSAALNVSAPMGVDGAETIWNVYGSMGYFLTDRMELEVAVGHASAGDLAATSVLGGVNWYFVELFDDMYPYLGASLSMGFGDQDGSRFQAKAGMRQYFSAHSGIRYWVQYDTELDRLFKGEGWVTAYVGFFTLAY